MMQRQEIYSLQNSGRKFCCMAKTFSPLRWVMISHFFFRLGFKEKTGRLFRELKSQYFIFYKYWLFFNSKILIFNPNAFNSLRRHKSFAEGK
jgi:hypothetical protein